MNSTRSFLPDAEATHHGRLRWPAASVRLWTGFVSFTKTALVLTALAVAGGSELSALAEDKLPPLILGNRPVDRAAVNPQGSNAERPQYLVPPARQPLAPLLPAPKLSGPAVADEAPTSKPKSQTFLAPRRASESETPQTPVNEQRQADERKQQLDRLSVLLDELNEHLQQPAQQQAERDSRSENPQLPAQKALDGESPAAIEAGSTHPPEAVEPAALVPETPATETAPLTDPVTPETPHDDPATAVSTQSLPAAIDPLPSEWIEPLPARIIAEPEIPTVPTPNEHGAVSTPIAPSADGTGGESVLPFVSTTLDAPVDRLALADNLYAAGETSLALNVYAGIDPQQSTEFDRHWVQLQLGGCYRRLGDHEAAAKHYRQLVTVENPAWMADIARWWIKTLDARRAAIRQSNDMQTTIKLLEEYLHDELGS